MRKPLARNAMYTLLCAGFVVLAGCNQAPTPAAGPAAASTAPSASSAPAPAQAAAAQAAPYTPPTADQLYQLVAPIALFPDNLVAQVLAGSTFPDQITAADNFLAQNPSLNGAPLLAQVNTQPWDASVKSLTTFPSVLDQMAKNPQWTSALGEAYVNDPTDVMNGIQVMRQRASQKGNLRSTAQQVVQTQPVAAAADNTTYADDGQESAYDGPSVVQAPDQYIEIAPAQQDTVYVPSYDPQTVYGGDVPVYPSYSYQEPRRYSTGEIVTAGAVSFGAGILIGSLLEGHHHDGGGYNNPPPPPGGGWHSWGMNWGGRGAGGGQQRPAVIHNNSTYVSNSTTVVNRYTTNNINNSRTTNNINNSRTTNNNINNNPNQAAPNREFANRNVINPARPAANEAPAAAPRGAMSVPHFGNTPEQAATAGREARPQSRMPNNPMQPNEAASRTDMSRMPPAHPPVAEANREMRPTPAAAQPPRETARPMPQHASPPAPREEAAPRFEPRPTVAPHEAPAPREAAPVPREAAPVRQAPAPRQPPAQRANAAHPVPPAHPNEEKRKKDDNNGHS